MGGSFQALATAQGEEFVRECVLALTRAGFEVVGERVDLVDTGCEVDLLARGATGVVFYIECKGSFMRRPGLQRTDTLRKAIANMALIHHRGYGALMLMTSHRPAGGRGTVALQLAHEIARFVVIVPRDDFAELRRLAAADAGTLGARWGLAVGAPVARELAHAGDGQAARLGQLGLF